MSPEQAVRLQVLRYQQMTGEQRLGVALRLHELACSLAREGIRRQHPTASADEVEDLLHRRLRMVTGA